MADAWRQDALARALAQQAEALMARLEGGAALSSLGLPVTVQPPLRRTDRPAALPEGLLDRLFAIDPGDSVSQPAEGRVVIAQLDRVLPADPADPEMVALAGSVRAEVAQGIGADAFDAFVRAVQRDAGITLNQAAISAVLAQLQ